MTSSTTELVTSPSHIPTPLSLFSPCFCLCPETPAPGTAGWNKASSLQAPGRQRIETQQKKSQNGHQGLCKLPVQPINLTAPKGKDICWDTITSLIYLLRGPGTPKRQRRLECCQIHQVTSFLWTETQRGRLMKESTGYTWNAHIISPASGATGVSNQF